MGRVDRIEKCMDEDVHSPFHVSGTESDAESAPLEILAEMDADEGTEFSLPAAIAEVADADSGIES